MEWVELCVCAYVSITLFSIQKTWEVDAFNYCESHFLSFVSEEDTMFSFWNRRYQWDQLINKRDLIRLTLFVFLTVRQQPDRMVFRFDYHRISCHNNDYTSLHESIKRDTSRDFCLVLHKRSAKEKNILSCSKEFDFLSLTNLFRYRIDHSNEDVLFMTIVN